MKNFFSNHFTGSKSMNIAQGANAIASQVNSIVQQVMTGCGDNVAGSKVCIGSGNKSNGDQVVSCQVSTSGNQNPAIKNNGNVVVTYSEDGKSRTVVTQQIQGNGNICSGAESVTVNGIRMQGGESVVVIDDNVFINKMAGKVEQSKDTVSGKTIADSIKAEVFRLHGKAGQGFADALDALTKKTNVQSKAGNGKRRVRGPESARKPCYHVAAVNAGLQCGFRERSGKERGQPAAPGNSKR